VLSSSDWAKAVPAFRVLVAAESANPRAWFGLHVALHGVEQFDEALTTLAKAAELGCANPGQIQFRFARTYARKGDAEKAFDALNAFVNADFRAFDFWIGEWDVQPAGRLRGPQGASSVIEKSLEGCLIIEHW